jgi:hypothetical protein
MKLWPLLLLATVATAQEPKDWIWGDRAVALAQALLDAEASTPQIFKGLIQVNRLRCLAASEAGQASLGAPPFNCEFNRIGVVDHEPYWTVSGEHAQALMAALKDLALEDDSAWGHMAQSAHVRCHAGFDLSYEKVLSARCYVEQKPIEE